MSRSVLDGDTNTGDTDSETRRRGEMTYDYIVIGGGVHGSAASYHLSKSGAAVLMLEAKTIACGASGGVGYRGVRANARDIRELPLMRIAYEIWPGINDELGISPGYQRLGGLELIGHDVLDDASLRDELETRVKVQSAFGIDTRLIDRAALDQLEPGAAASVGGAIYCPDDGVGDHTEVTRGYARAAQKSGADVQEGTAATRIEQTSAGYAVTTSGGEVHVARKQVLVMANSYSRRLLHDSFGVDLPTTLFNPQMTPVRTKSGFAFQHLLGHYSLPFAAKSLGDGSVMLSGGRTGGWDYDNDAGFTRAEIAERSVIDAGSLYPEFEGAEIVLTDASRPDSKCVDDIPIIDTVPGHDGVLFATGWSGHGFAIAPAVATLIAQWCTTGQKPVELEPFAFSRFPN